MAPSDPQTTDTGATSSASDVADQLEQLQEQINRAQQTIRQIQNVTGTGVGTTTPAKTRGGITITPVSSIKATVGSSNSSAGETQLSVTWTDAPPPAGASIDHYNVYVAQGIVGQTQPTLIGGTKQSPFVGSFQTTSASNTAVFVQTVLSNGQSLPLAACPTTTVVGVNPKTGVQNTLGGLLVGYQIQVPAVVTVTTANNNAKTTILSFTGGAGALLTIEFPAGGAGANTIHTTAGSNLNVTADGTTVINIPLTDQGAGGPDNLDVDFQYTAFNPTPGASNPCTVGYYLAFNSSINVSITASSFFSGQSTCVVGWAKKL